LVKKGKGFPLAKELVAIGKRGWKKGLKGGLRKGFSGQGFG